MNNPLARVVANSIIRQPTKIPEQIKDDVLDYLKQDLENDVITQEEFDKILKEQ